MKFLCHLQCIDGDWAGILYAAIDVINFACLHRRKSAPARPVLQRMLMSILPPRISSRASGARAITGSMLICGQSGIRSSVTDLAPAVSINLGDECVFADGDDGVVPDRDQDARGWFPGGARSYRFDAPFRLALSAAACGLRLSASPRLVTECRMPASPCGSTK